MAVLNGIYQYTTGEQVTLTISNTEKSDESDVNDLWSITNEKLAILEADMALVNNQAELAEQWATSDQGVDLGTDEYSAKANAEESENWANAAAGAVVLADGTTSLEESSKTYASNSSDSADASASSASDAQDAEDYVLAAVNFKGAWSAGTYTFPSTVVYLDKYWLLLEGTTTGIPGTSADWQDLSYYTQAETDILLTGKSDTSHTHGYLPLAGGTMSATGSVIFPVSDYGVQRDFIGTDGRNILRNTSSGELLIGSSLWNEVDIKAGTAAITVNVDGLGSNGILAGDGTDLYVGPAINDSVTVKAVYSGGDTSTMLGLSANRWHTVYSTNGVLTTSDETLKDCSPIGDCSWILGIDLISFRWKDDPERVHYGVSAQDVYNKSPKKDTFLAHPPGAGQRRKKIKKGKKDKHGNIVDEDTIEIEDVMSQWGLAPTEFIFPMLQIIKDLEARVAKLELKSNKGAV